MYVCVSVFVCECVCGSVTSSLTVCVSLCVCVRIYESVCSWLSVSMSVCGYVCVLTGLMTQFYTCTPYNFRHFCRFIRDNYSGWDS